MIFEFHTLFQTWAKWPPANQQQQQHLYSPGTYADKIQKKNK